MELTAEDLCVMVKCMNLPVEGVQALETSECLCIELSTMYW